MKQSSIIHKINKIILSVFSIGIFIYIPKSYAGYFDELQYYSGVSAGYQYGGFKPNYGENFISAHSADYELFIGGQSNEMFGFEAGISFTPEVNKTLTIYPGEYYPGATVPVPAGMWQTWQSQYETDSVYLGINRYFQLTQRGNFRMFGFVGIAAASIDVTINFVDDDDNGTPSQSIIDASQRTYSEVNIIPMVKLGFEYNWTEHFGSRIAYTWKNYAAFGAIKSSEFPDLSIEIQPKDTNAIYLSIFVNF